MKSLAVDDGSTIGCDNVTDLITIAGTGDITIKDGSYDFDLAAHDGTNGLKLGGALVTSSAAELNYNDITTLGSSQASKVLTADASGDITIVGASANVVWDKSEDALEFADNASIEIGTGLDMKLYHDGSNSYITNAVGALKIATETSGIAVTIGHSTSEVTIGDNLTVIGSLTPEKTKLGVGTSSINFTPSTDGHLLTNYSRTFTDSSTSAGGTAASNFGLVKLFAPTLASSAGSSITTTRASTFEISGAPIAGTNNSLSDSYALRVNSGNSYFGGTIQLAGSTRGSAKLAAAANTRTTQGGTTALNYTITLPALPPSADEFLKVTSYGSDIATTEWASGAGGASTIDGLSDASINTSNQLASIFLGNDPTNNGTSNIGIGIFALDSMNSSGSPAYNIGIGNNALTTLTTASNNVAIGQDALKLNTTGFSNIAIGRTALTANTTGGFNLALGANTLSSNTTGFYNVGLGHGVLTASSSAGSNVSIGYNSSAAVTSGSQNTVVGTSGGSAITSGSENTVVGSSSLVSTTVGDNNVSIGAQALYSNVEGGGNTGLGAKALYKVAPSGAGSNTYSYNTALGYEAGYQITSGKNNTILGVKAAHDWIESGSFGGDGSPTSTVFILEDSSGKSSVNDFYNGWTITFASDTTTVALRGDSATVSDYVGSSRTMTVGSGLSAAPASGDTYTLTNGVALTTGSNNTVLGYDARTSVATVSNEITLGNSSVTSLRCADTTIASLSDSRDKTNVVDSPYGLDFIDSLRPVQFTWQRRVLEPSDENHPKNGTTRVGFLAQDLQTAMPSNENDVLDLVYDVNPERIEAKYGNLIPVLTQAIKDLKAQNDALTARVAALENA